MVELIGITRSIAITHFINSAGAGHVASLGVVGLFFEHGLGGLDSSYKIGTGNS